MNIWNMHPHTHPTHARVYEFRNILQGFGRGSTVMYQLSTAHDLGHLQYVRVWHDSSGRGAHHDWLLSEIGVEDLQTHERCAARAVLEPSRLLQTLILKEFGFLGHSLDSAFLLLSVPGTRFCAGPGCR